MSNEWQLLTINAFLFQGSYTHIPHDHIAYRWVCQLFNSSMWNVKYKDKYMSNTNTNTCEIQTKIQVKYKHKYKWNTNTHVIIVISTSGTGHLTIYYECLVSINWLFQTRVISPKLHGVFRWSKPIRILAANITPPPPPEPRWWMVIFIANHLPRRPHPTTKSFPNTPPYELSFQSPPTLLIFHTLYFFEGSLPWNTVKICHKHFVMIGIRVSLQKGYSCKSMLLTRNANIVTRWNSHNLPCYVHQTYKFHLWSFQWWHNFAADVEKNWHFATVPAAALLLAVRERER